MEYKHFSHPHNLNIFKAEESQQILCHGCQSLCHDSNVYACWKCNFFLHEHCGNATRYVNHPSHPLHPLILIPSPTYCSGSFVCNACGKNGNSFAYCCALCEIDLHINCAFRPPKISHKAHQHELIVSFGESHQKGSSEFCKICTKTLGSKNWSYCCLEPDCDFQVHTGCGTTEVKPGLYQGDDPNPEVQSTSAAPASQKNDCEATENKAQAEPAPAPADPVAELLQLQLQMQMAEQLAQMMASFNLSQFV